ncbi:MAG: hypothetical protein AB2721_17645 [Candidatus Thiodiazotropha sp.]
MLKLDIYDSSLKNITNQKYDIYICATGYEKRARYLSKKLFKEKIDIAKIKLCLAFTDHKDKHDRPANDIFFKSHGYKIIDDFPTFGRLSSYLRNSLHTTNESEKTLSVLIDYSVMRRSTYSEILLFARYLSDNGIRVRVVFSYTVGVYMGSKQPKIVDDYRLIAGFDGVGSQKKEKYGVYNLGFEPYSVSSVHEWIEPKKVKAIVANPGAMNGSANKCIQLNKNFIDTSGCEILEIPLYSVRNYCLQVNEILKNEASQFDVVILGVGPKPFTLGGLLCSTSKVNVSNVYIRGVESEPINVESTGQLVVTVCQFN